MRAAQTGGEKLKAVADGPIIKRAYHQGLVLHWLGEPVADPDKSRQGVGHAHDPVEIALHEAQVLFQGPCRYGEGFEARASTKLRSLLR